MRSFFSILSLAYITGIFLWADSPMVSDLAPFNPYNLLHIPLYGILTVLITFSFVPIRIKRNTPTNVPNVLNVINGTDKTDGTDETDGIDETDRIDVPNVLNDPNHPNVTNEHNAFSRLRFNALTRLFFAGSIALIVAIADEIH